MNKKQILSMFLKEGVLVPPDLLVKINEDNYEEILKSLKGEGTSGKETKKTFKTEKRRKESSVKDLLDHYSRKYEFLKGVLLKKVNAVSINKGKKIFSKTSIIGRVKERTARGFVVEDVTGETEVVTDKKGILEGDVIGLKGWFKEGGFLPDEFVWPDIPLENKAELPDFLLTKRLTEKIMERGEKGVFLVNIDSSEKEKQNPSRINISHGEKNFLVLVFKPDEEISDQDFPKILKRMELPHREDGGIYTSYLIENVPDVIWFIENRKNWTKNYKGLVMVSTDHESFFEYKKNEGGKFDKI